MDFFSKTVNITERLLTWRARRKYKIKQKSKLKWKKRDTVLKKILGVLREFIEVVIIVLLINQYILQAYAIPSSSMVDTLLIGDRLIVDKLTPGPELLPTIGKLPSLTDVKRGDIVVFENPSYESPGVLFEIVYRFIYMISFGQIDINKNPNGTPKAVLLVKRAVGMPGDVLRFIDGDIYFYLPWEDKLIDERDLISNSHLFKGNPRRIFNKNFYLLGYSTMRYGLLNREGLYSSVDDRIAAETYNKIVYELRNKHMPFSDNYFDSALYSYMTISMYPYQKQYLRAYMDYNMGIFIPSDMFLPLGDNRDNSNDGRYFGLIKQKDVLGKVVFRFWPPTRMGVVK